MLTKCRRSQPLSPGWLGSKSVKKAAKRSTWQPQTHCQTVVQESARGAKRPFVDVRCSESEMEANRSGSDGARLSLAGRLHDLEHEQTSIHRSICFVLRVDEAVGDGP